MEIATVIVIGILALWFFERRIDGSLEAYDRSLPEVEERVVEEIDGHLQEILEMLEEFSRRHETEDLAEEFESKQTVGSIRFDLFRLFAYLSAWDRTVTPGEQALIESVVGYTLDEKDLLSIAEEMDRQMGEEGYLFSLLCVRLARIEPDTARRYLEKLIEIGRIFLRETGETDARIALDYFALMGRISIQSHSWINRRIALTEPAPLSA